jgi:acetyl esterase/lipase
LRQALRGLRAFTLVLLVTGCTSTQFFVANAPTAFHSLERHRDLPYGTDPRQRLDVYAPPHALSRPVVIFWYGGSWVKGSKAQYRFVGEALAEHGFVAVLPDYRLYPQVSFPLFDEDGARAVAWVQEHIRDFGGDPRRIVLMGHSAGGHTAAFLAFNHAFLRKFGGDPRSIVGLVGLSGTYVLVPDTDELRATFPAPYTERDWQPIRFVDSQAPPTLLLHGLDDKEVYPQEAIDLKDALLKKNVRVDLHLYPHRGHADTVAPFALVARWRSPAVKDTIDFIESVTSHQE